MVPKYCKAGQRIGSATKDLSSAELERYVSAIERAEGKFKPGKIIKVQPKQVKQKITAVKKNKRGTIVRYRVEGFSWLSKAKAIELTAAGKIDAVVATSRSGSTYLRARPDKASTNNLEKLG